MTQAPTPSPLTAEDWASLADLHTLKGWLHGVSLTPDWDDVVSDGGVTVAMVVQQEAGQMASRVGRVIDNFRLAPTAPVEASGSFEERALMLTKKHGNPVGTDYEQGQNDMGHRMVTMARQADAAIAALRPKPSGETREDRLSAALIAMVEHFERVDAAPEDKAAIQAACEVWAGVKRDKALSTTPARAEAQDEGAEGEQTDCKTCRGNGEIVTDWDRYLGAPQPGDQGDEGTADCPDCDGTGKINVIDAHPSPTPAADADRVREAIADVISHESDWRTALTAMDAAEETPEDGSGKPGYWLHQIKVLDRILAALKSTAAKEGGE